MVRIRYDEIKASIQEFSRTSTDVKHALASFSSSNQQFRQTNMKLSGQGWDSARKHFSLYDTVSQAITGALTDADATATHFLSDFVNTIGEPVNDIDTD